MSTQSIDQKAQDSLAHYTYQQIARIGQIDPARAIELRRLYSSALASGDQAREARAGEAIENIHAKMAREMYKKGILR
jgi:DNA-binding SARP family transcriptional activator